MLRGTEATWQSPGGPRGWQEAHSGVATWQEATRSRDPRGRLCGAPRGDRMACGGPTGIVGLGESVGAVTQMRYRLT